MAASVLSHAARRTSSTQAAGPSEGVGPRVRIRLAPALSHVRTRLPRSVGRAFGTIGGYVAGSALSPSLSLTWNRGCEADSQVARRPVARAREKPPRVGPAGGRDDLALVEGNLTSDAMYCGPYQTSLGSVHDKTQSIYRSPRAARDRAPDAGRLEPVLAAELRDTERAITFWRQKASECGGLPPSTASNFPG